MRGCAVAPAQDVVLDDPDLAGLPVPRRHTSALDRCVPAEAIDPASLDRPYGPAPEPTATPPFALLLRALRERGLVGLGRVPLRQREARGALRPVAGRFLLSTLYAADAVQLEAIDPVDPAAVDADHWRWPAS